MPRESFTSSFERALDAGVQPFAAVRAGACAVDRVKYVAMGGMDLSDMNALQANGRKRQQTRLRLRVAVAASIVLHLAIAFWPVQMVSMSPGAPLEATITV